MVRDLSTFQVIPVCPQHFSKCRTVCYYNFNFYFELYIIRDFDDDKRMQSGGWVKKKSGEKTNEVTFPVWSNPFKTVDIQPAATGNPGPAQQLLF